MEDSTQKVIFNQKNLNLINQLFSTKVQLGAVEYLNIFNENILQGILSTSSVLKSKWRMVTKYSLRGANRRRCEWKWRTYERMSLHKYVVNLENSLKINQEISSETGF